MCEAIYHTCQNCNTIYFANWDDIDCPFCNGDEKLGQEVSIYKEIILESNFINIGAITGLLEFYSTRFTKNVVNFGIDKYQKTIL